MAHPALSHRAGEPRHDPRFGSRRCAGVRSLPPVAPALGSERRIRARPSVNAHPDVVRARESTASRLVWRNNRHRSAPPSPRAPDEPSAALEWSLDATPLPIRRRRPHRPAQPGRCVSRGCPGRDRPGMTNTDVRLGTHPGARTGRGSITDRPLHRPFRYVTVWHGRVALTNAERQARCRVWRKASESRVRYRRPADRRSRPAADREWSDALPVSLAGSATVELLEQVCRYLEAVELPGGFRRDGWRAGEHLATRGRREVDLNSSLGPPEMAGFEVSINGRF